MRSLTLIIAATMLLASVLSLNSVPSEMASVKMLARRQHSQKAMHVLPEKVLSASELKSQMSLDKAAFDVTLYDSPVKIVEIKIAVPQDATTQE